MKIIKNEYILNIVILILLFSFTFIINSISPLWADDLCRAGVKGFEVLKKSHDEYFNWSGRYFVLVQSYFFFGGSRVKLILLNIINSGMLIALVFFIFKCANLRNPNKKSDSVDLIVITTLLFCFCEAFAEVIFWKTGTINYLWGTTGEMVVIYFFISKAVKFNSNLAIKIIFPIFTFYIATYLEHLSFAVSLFLIYWGFDQAIKKGRILKVYYLSILTHILGGLFLVIAPGNYVRQEFIPLKQPIMYRVLDHLKAYENLILDNGWGLACLAAILIVLKMPSKDGCGTNFAFNNSRLNRIKIFLVLSVLGGLALAIPGVKLAERMAFPSEVFLTVVIATILGGRNKFKILNLLISGVAIFLIFIPITLIFIGAAQIRTQSDYRNYLIDSLKMNNAKFYLIPLYYLNEENRYNTTKHPKWVFMRDITTTPADWTNACFINGGIKLNGEGAKNNIDISIKAIPSPVFLEKDILKRIDLNLSPEESPSTPSIFKGEKNIYYAFKNSCENLKKEDFIFLHIYPEKLSALKPEQRQYGIENLDFKIELASKAVIINNNGSESKSYCVLYSKLPDYKFNTIKTGQFNPTSNYRSWERTMEISDNRPLLKYFINSEEKFN